MVIQGIDRKIKQVLAGKNKRHKEQWIVEADLRWLVFGDIDNPWRLKQTDIGDTAADLAPLFLDEGAPKNTEDGALQEKIIEITKIIPYLANPSWNLLPLAVQDVKGRGKGNTHGSSLQECVKEFERPGGYENMGHVRQAVGTTEFPHSVTIKTDQQLVNDRRNATTAPSFSKQRLNLGWSIVVANTQELLKEVEGEGPDIPTVIKQAQKPTEKMIEWGWDPKTRIELSSDPRTATGTPCLQFMSEKMSYENFVEWKLTLAKDFEEEALAVVEKVNEVVEGRNKAFREETDHRFAQKIEVRDRVERGTGKGGGKGKGKGKGNKKGTCSQGGKDRDQQDEEMQKEGSDTEMRNAEGARQQPPLWREMPEWKSGGWRQAEKDKYQESQWPLSWGEEENKEWTDKDKSTKCKQCGKKHSGKCYGKCQQCGKVHKPPCRYAVQL
jgi:hypothetical protein